MNFIKKIFSLIKEHPVFFCFFLIALLYFIPTLIQVEFDKDLHITRFYLGLPGVLSGDEPHYFVTTTSLINDHDYYIDNNYDNAYYFGGCDVSFHYINNTNPSIERHIQLVDPERKVVIPRYINRTYEGNETKLYEKFNVTTLRQVSNRPIGLPFFSALFLWPLQNTCFIEHAAIYLSLVVSFIGVIFFYLIVRFFIQKYSGIKDTTSQRNIALLFTLLFALCTQYWHYSKTYFTEPYLASFLLIAYYFTFVKNKEILSGLALGIGFAMKYPFGMYLFFFTVLLLYERQWKRILSLSIGSCIPILGTLYYNWLLSGNMLHFGQGEFVTFGNYLYGIYVWLLDPVFGLLPATPFLIFSAYGFFVLYKQDKKLFLQFTLLILPYFFFWTSYLITQTGAGGYSARYMVPLLSFFVLLCLFWYMRNRTNSCNKSKVFFWLFILLVIYSFIINLQAAFLYPLFWNNPPWIVFDFILTHAPRIKEIIFISFFPS